MKRLSGTIPEHIAQRVAALRALDAALSECLPADCAAHCQAAGLSDGTLHLVADSPAWRARLHFFSSRIINQISRLGKFHVSRISIRVGRPQQRDAAPAGTRRGRSIPPEAARGLASLARETTEPELRSVLERLARLGDSEQTNGQE